MWLNSLAPVDLKCGFSETKQTPIRCCSISEIRVGITERQGLSETLSDSFKWSYRCALERLGRGGLATLDRQVNSNLYHLPPRYKFDLTVWCWAANGSGVVDTRQYALITRLKSLSLSPSLIRPLS